MPKAKAIVSQEDKIKAFQDGEAPKPQVIQSLPTPEEQQEAVEEPKSHLITLLDDAIVEMRTDLTVADVLKKRLNAKILSYALLIRSELAQYAENEREQALSIVISASDTLYEKGIALLAQVTGKAVEVFRDNISAEQLTAAVLTLVNAIEKTLKKVEAAK